jgi:predicted nucleic acid-binding Zn ribbon protein
MERAARVFQKNKLSKNLLTDEDVLRAAWPAAVGKAIAAHTSRVRLVRTCLVVEVEDAIWQRQLRGLSHQVLDRVRKLTGHSSLTDIEFRIGVPRRQPQRAETPQNDFSLAPSGDEADQIQDPVLKKVYRLSRRKAFA